MLAVFSLCPLYVLFLICLTHHFQEVLNSTRVQLERELALEDITSIKDLPAYNMLNQ